MSISLKQLQAACRENDQEAKTRGLAVALVVLGTNASDVSYIAEQRALRAVMIEYGIPIPATAQGIELTKEQKDKLKRYSIAYMDGIAIGLRAAKDTQ